MPIIERFKNLFRGQPSHPQRKALPSIVEYGINPIDLWEVLGDLGDGAFGKVEKVCRRDNPEQLAAAKVCLFTKINFKLNADSLFYNKILLILFKFYYKICIIFYLF